MPITKTTITITSNGNGGDRIEVNGLHISSLSFTNNTGVDIAYSTNSGASFTTVAAGASATLVEGDPDKYRFRRVGVGASAPLLLEATAVMSTSMNDGFFGSDASGNITGLAGPDGKICSTSMFTVDSVTYDADDKATSYIEGGIVYTITYNTDGTVNTVSGGGVTRAMTYNADGTVASYQ